MRCKNCGSENDDNLYICQNCGSPLYDDEDSVVEDDDMGKTRVAPVVQSNQKPAQGRQQSPQNKNEKNEYQKKKEKTIIIIVVLAVVLAVVIAVLAAVLIGNSKKNNDVEDTSFSTTISTTERQTTAQSTTAQTTTETTTENTTQTTTQAAVEYTVSVSCSQGGEVEGDGSYADGEKCTVIARADDNYEFDGWYKNGKRVSSNEVYTFTVKSNTDLEAVFTDITDVTEDYE